MDKKESMYPLVLINILMLMTLMQMTADQYLPSLPAIAREFGNSNNSVQLTLSLYFLGSGLSHLFYGPLSDKIGRKPPLMFGISLNIVGSICCFFAPSIVVLIIGRFLQGFGIGCCMSVGRSLMRDLYNNTFLAKVGSYVGMVNIFVIVSAPILGGYIQQHYGWRYNFLFLFLMGLIVLFFSKKFLPETNKHLNPNAIKIKVMLKNYSTLIHSNVFVGYTLCSCFACAGIISYMTISPFLFQNILGLSPIEYGRLSIFIAAGICFSGLINSVTVTSKGIAYMVLVGVGLMVLGSFSLFVFSLLGIASVLTIMIPVSLFAMGAGFIFINTFAGAFQPFPTIAGVVGALYACTLDLGGALISGGIAAFVSRNQLSFSIILGSLALLSFISWKIAQLPTSKEQTDSLK